MNETILHIISESPNALRPYEIVDQVLAHHRTTSADPRKMVFSYVAQLRNKGKLVKDKHGRLAVARNGAQMEFGGEKQERER